MKLNEIIEYTNTINATVKILYNNNITINGNIISGKFQG